MPLVPSIGARYSLFRPALEPTDAAPLHARPASLAGGRVESPCFRPTLVSDRGAASRLAKRARQISGVKRANHVEEFVELHVMDAPTKTAVLRLYDKFSHHPAMVEVLLRLIGRACLEPTDTGARIAFLLNRFAAYSDHRGSNIKECVALLEDNVADSVRQASIMYEFGAFELMANLPESRDVVFSDVIDGQEIDVAATLAEGKVWVEAKLGGFINDYQAREILVRARKHKALVVFVARLTGDHYAEGEDFASLRELERICDQPDISKRREFFERLNERAWRVYGTRVGHDYVPRSKVHTRLAPGSAVRKKLVVVEPPPVFQSKASKRGLDSQLPISQARKVLVTTRKPKPSQADPRKTSPTKTPLATASAEPVRPALPLKLRLKNEQMAAYHDMRARLSQINKDDAAIVDWMIYSGLKAIPHNARVFVTTEVWRWIAADNSDTRFTLFKAFAVDFAIFVTKNCDESGSVNIPRVLNEFAFGAAHTQTSA